MKKQSKQLVIMAILLLVLVAAFFGLKQYNKGQKEKADSVKAEYLFDLAKEDVTRISYDYQGVRYTFEKGEEGWYYTEDPSLALNQSSMDTMQYRLANMEILQTIENVTDMAQYGLENYRTLQCETSSESYTLHIGNYNEISGVYYVSNPSENTVYTVSDQTVLCFSRTPENLKQSE